MPGVVGGRQQVDYVIYTGTLETLIMFQLVCDSAVPVQVRQPKSKSVLEIISKALANPHPLMIPQEGVYY